MRRSEFWIATCFGLGCSPFAPGTVGSLAAIPFAFVLLQLSVYAQVLAIILLLLISYHAAEKYGLFMQNSDHKSIVCDEVCGLLPILLLVSPDLWLLAFVLFRFFDIFKPWPIGWLDAHLKGALGCMVDDLVAGVMSYFTLVLLTMY
jgi:phosphatidylglycerophosphatase A